MSNIYPIMNPAFCHDFGDTDMHVFLRGRGASENVYHPIVNHESVNEDSAEFISIMTLLNKGFEDASQDGEKPVLSDGYVWDATLGAVVHDPVSNLITWVGTTSSARVGSTFMTPSNGKTPR